MEAGADLAVGEDFARRLETDRAVAFEDAFLESDIFWGGDGGKICGGLAEMGGVLRLFGLSGDGTGCVAILVGYGTA